MIPCDNSVYDVVWVFVCIMVAKQKNTLLRYQ